MTYDASDLNDDLQIRPIRAASLDSYSELLSNSFQNFNPTVAYLDWLYFQNPRGSVVGYDAYHGETLVAHYACIPIKIDGYQFNSLLSLNTATHPDYQGRGLFRLLATKTYEEASPFFANVIGVANSKSVGGFVKHLGFTKIGHLELRIGKLSRQVQGSRIYSKEDLKWRTRCPGRPLKVVPLGLGKHLISTKPLRIAPSLKSIIFEEGTLFDNSQTGSIGATLDWRRDINPVLKLPKSLKPSPLVLIFKPLLETDSTLLTSFSMPDFDAF